MEHTKERGHAISNAIPIEHKNIREVYEHALDFLSNQLSLNKIYLNNSVTHMTGSFLIQKEHGDLDVLIDIKELSYNTNIEIAFDEIFKKLSDCKYEVVSSKGFNEISVGLPYKDGVCQIDFILTECFPFTYWMLTADDNKYKNLYSNLLLMAVISEAYKSGDDIYDPFYYSMFALRPTTGLWYVKKSFLSKSNNKLKTARIVSEHFITSDKDTISSLCFGKYLNKTFEKYWNEINTEEFMHKDKLDRILSKFKHYLDSANKPYPDIVINDYPEIFKYE